MNAAQAGQAKQAGPIDLEHLARQTGGDHALAREVLALFAEQARQALDQLAARPPDAVPAAMHRLKGAARAVGAFEVADNAAHLEDAPRDEHLRGRLAAALVAVLDALEGPGSA